MLLSLQAKLVQLTKENAVIEVSSNWISMVQSRASLIETAIKATLGDSVRLKLERATEPPQNNANNLPIKKNLSKMKVDELRILVVTKNLTDNDNEQKLKKSELIKLLQ